MAAAHYYAHLDRARAQLHAPGPTRFGPADGTAPGGEQSSYPPLVAAAAASAGEDACEEVYEIGEAAPLPASAPCTAPFPLPAPCPSLCLRRALMRAAVPRCAPRRVTLGGRRQRAMPPGGAARRR